MLRSIELRSRHERHDIEMSHQVRALDWAEAQVAAVRDDPAGRLALLARTYHGPMSRAADRGAPRRPSYFKSRGPFNAQLAERGAGSCPSLSLRLRCDR